MKPSNIIAGRKYKHSDYPGIIYTGIILDGYKRKQKYLLSSHSSRIVLSPRQQRREGYKFWSKFSLAD